MTAPEPLSARARAYLDEIDRQLRDLPPEQRSELRADVAARLAELEDDRSPAAALGPAVEFATDLRHAAGLEPSAVMLADRPPSVLPWLRL